MGIFSRRHEQRAQYYSPAVEDALFNAALTGKVDAAQTAAATAAVKAISDPFATAEVTPPTLASILTPSVLVDMARHLLLTGNAVYLIDITEGGQSPSLVPTAASRSRGASSPPHGSTA